MKVVTTADVARLADVQRPVVSMWRRRFAGTDRAFPTPVSSTTPGQALLFDADAVTSWLTTTGLGNNPAVVVEATAHARRLSGSDAEHREVDALSALLCLAAVTGAQLTGRTPDELLDLAEEIDPDDSWLFRELVAAEDALTELAADADQLTEAAFHPAQALETLLADRLPLLDDAHRHALVAEPALRFVATLAGALLRAATGGVELADATGGGGDLVLRVIATFGEDVPVQVAIPAGNTQAERLLRRRLCAHGVAHRVSPPPAAAARTGTGSRPARVQVAQYPHTARPGMSTVDTLRDVEACALDLGDDDWAVVLGPAAALTEPLRDRGSDGVRADLLRAGRVRAVIRLPKGLAPARGREALAVWVLRAARRRGGAADERSLVADLVDRPLTGGLAETVAAEMLAAGDPERPQSWGGVLRPVLLRRLLTAPRSLVELAPPPVFAPRSGAQVLARLQIETTALGDSRWVRPALPSLVAGDDLAVTEPVTIEAAVRAGHLLVVPGARVDLGLARVGGGEPGRLRVIGVGEVIGVRPLGARTLDRLDVTARHPNVRLTEPGDVVLCTAPRPAAIVDPDGGSLVAFPARVLRVSAADPGGLLPQVIAADVAAQPEGARSWRRWPLRRVSDTLVAPCREAFAALERAQQQTQQRLARLATVTQVFTEAVTGGGVTLPPARPKSKSTTKTTTKGR